jgi:hypothetical protein
VALATLAITSIPSAPTARANGSAILFLMVIYALPPLRDWIGFPSLIF